MRNAIEQLHIGTRSLLRAPGFTIVSTLTLALGIGAVMAIFTIIDAVVLRPLPYPDPERLVSIHSVVPAQDPDEVWGLSVAGYFLFRERSQTLEAIGAVDGVFEDIAVTLAGTDGAVRVPGDSVSASLLTVLGARAALGRLFDEEDDRPGTPPVVVLSHQVWSTHFGADSALLGRTLHMDGVAREVIGVMEPGFRMPGRVSGVWVPFRLDPSRPPVNEHSYGAIARLREGSTVGDAQRELDRFTAQFTRLFPDAYDDEFMEEWGFATRVEPLQSRVIGNIAGVLWPLFGGVALVLLIALANVSNLFLLRTEDRREEFAVRSAFGAGRARLAAEGLIEGLIIGVLATACGLVIAHVALDALIAATPDVLPRLEEMGVGWRSAALAAAVVSISAIIIGSLPRLWARFDVELLRGSAKGHTLSLGRQPVRRTLVAAQIALACTLLAATGLMLRSFQRLYQQDKGFEDRGVLAFQVPLPVSLYDSEATARFYRELLERIEALPGVARAGGATHLPLGHRDGCWATYSPDTPTDPNQPPPCVQVWATTPGYFETLNVPVRGQPYRWDEVATGSLNVRVTKALADRFWPGEDPIGKRVRGYSWGSAPFYVVAGVTEDLRDEGVDRAVLQGVFLPAVNPPGMPTHWGPFWGREKALEIVVRVATGSPQNLVPAIRSALADIDPDIATGEFHTMSELVARSESVARTALMMRLLAVATVLALFLTGVGLYGVVSYFVRRRTREIGLRIALGADAEAVARTVLRQALHVALAGVAAGVVASLGVTRVLRSLVFGVHPNDPLVLLAAVLVLVALIGVAAWLPTRRATRIDPIQALQHE